MLRQGRRPVRYLLACGAGLLLPLALQDPYLGYLLVLTVIFSMLALSLDLILGHMGQFSFGHQAFFGVGAYTTAILTAKAKLPVWVGFLTGIAVATLLGLAIGLIALRRTRGLYLAIITLGFGKIVWLIARNWYGLTGGLSGIPSLPSPTLSAPGTGSLTLNTELSYYYFALAMLFVTIYAIDVFKRSRFGRAVASVRENEELARSIGINPFKAYVGAFTLATALAGLAGVTYAHFTTHVSPLSLSLYYMFWMLVMVIIGGRDTVIGPIVGAVIFVYVPEWLAVVDELKLVIFGAALLIVIVLMPEGIVPATQRFTAWAASLLRIKRAALQV